MGALQNSLKPNVRDATIELGLGYRLSVQILARWSQKDWYEWEAGAMTGRLTVEGMQVKPESI
ncbi:MAG: hypothetical protein ACI87E_001722 [Mariniblastus sp.]|jgi:hypothetical protein